jgi:hypothetical protein
MTMAIYKVSAKLVITLCVLSVAVVGQRRAASSSVVINTEPNAIVWIDEIRRGSTDASGRIELKVLPGRHAVKVRANGFKEAALPLLPGRRTLAVKLVRTTDQAELLFQQAEEARDKARDDAAKQEAAELYRKTLELRPVFPAARVGLARVLLDLNRRDVLAGSIPKHLRSKDGFSARLRSRRRRLQRFAGPSAKRKVFNLKRMWGSQECWKNRDSTLKQRLNTARQSRSFQTQSQ